MTIKEFYKKMVEEGLEDYDIRVYDHMGDTVWLEEGELDSVPRTWAFTENEIIEKFGEENLKYKLAIEDYKQNKY